MEEIKEEYLLVRIRRPYSRNSLIMESCFVLLNSGCGYSTPEDAIGCRDEFCDDPENVIIIKSWK